MPGKEVAEKRLTQVERVKLENCEVVIENGLRSFVDVGDALKQIRDSKLYRESHPTFEAYCKERWMLERRRAYQMIDSAAVALNVKNFSQSGAPAVESHANRLSKIDDPEDQAAAWEEVLETAPTDDEGEPIVTAKHVAVVVDDYLGNGDKAPESNADRGRRLFDQLSRRLNEVLAVDEDVRSEHGNFAKLVKSSVWPKKQTGVFCELLEGYRDTLDAAIKEIKPLLEGSA